MADLAAISGLAVLVGSLSLSAIGFVRGLGMRRFHAAQRLERRARGASGPLGNPRGRRRGKGA